MTTKIKTFSGRWLDLLDPNPDDIEVVDIAIGLSREYRFSNQTTEPLTVAQHSVLVAKQVIPACYIKEALLHDAAEAYLGDMSTPLKNLVGDAYRIVENRLLDAIFDRFGLRCLAPYGDALESVKRADNEVLEAEKIRFGIGRIPERNPGARSSAHIGKNENLEDRASRISLDEIWSSERAFNEFKKEARMLGV